MSAPQGNLSKSLTVNAATCDSMSWNLNDVKVGRTRLPSVGCDVPSNPLQIQNENRVKRGNQEQRNEGGDRESLQIV